MAKTFFHGKCDQHDALMAKLDHLNAFAEFLVTLPGISFTFEMDETGPQYRLYHKNLNNRATCILDYTQKDIEKMGENYLSTVIYKEDRDFVDKMFQFFLTGKTDAVFSTLIRLLPRIGNKVQMMLQCTVSLRYDNGRPRQIKGNGWIVEDNTNLNQQMYRCLNEDLSPEVLDKINELSDREKDVLKCQLNGLSAKETAAELNISFNTVNTHVKNIREKFHLTHNRSLIGFAVKNNLHIWLRAEE